MEFEKSKLMANINDLIKERGRKIGELEDAVGVSRGYLSRMSKAENESMPGVDLIYRLADELQVSIDMLISGNFDRSNDNLLYMVKFLNQLKTDTDLHELTWSVENVMEHDGDHTNPLFEFSSFVRAEDNEVVETYKYNSPFMPDASIGINGNSYYTWSEEFGDMYLMNLVMANGTNNFVKFFELVAFSASDGEMIPICSTLMDRGLNGTMLDLFNCIEMHDKDLKISDRAKRLMAVYLNKHSDDLPFN